MCVITELGAKRTVNRRGGSYRTSTEKNLQTTNKLSLHSEVCPISGKIGNVGGIVCRKTRVFRYEEESWSSTKMYIRGDRRFSAGTTLPVSLPKHFLRRPASF